MNIANSTLSGNSADYLGGTIFSTGRCTFGATLEIGSSILDGPAGDNIYSLGECTVTSRPV